MPRATQQQPYSFGDIGSQQLYGRFEATNLAGATLPTAVPYSLVAQWVSPNLVDQPDPVPVILGVEMGEVKSSGVVKEWAAEVSPDSTLVGDDFDDGINQGHLLVEYGAYGQAKRRIIDIRSGLYQLPPCHSVRVSVKQYNQTAAATSRTFRGTAGLAPGVLANPSVPTYSGTRAVAANTVSLQFDLPLGGRFVRFMNSEQPPVDNQYLLYSVSPNYYVDFSVPTWAGGPAADFIPASNAVSIEKTGVDTGVFTLQVGLDW